MPLSLLPERNIYFEMHRMGWQIVNFRQFALIYGKELEVTMY